MIENIDPLKKRLLVGLAVLSRGEGTGAYDSIVQLHKITKITLAKINTLLNELHQDGLITLHSHNTNLNEDS